MDTVVISLGGSLIVPREIDVEFLERFREAVLAYVEQGKRFIIICGGGKTCRNYQNAASTIAPVSDNDNDWVGIQSTRLNAELVRAVFGPVAYEKVYENPEQKVDTGKPVIIGAGWLPGHSSDMDAVQLAGTFGASMIINMSNVQRVHTADPKKSPDARPIDKISWDDFQKVVGHEWTPGLNTPFDPVASKKAKELSLKVVILGPDIDNFRNCIDGIEFVGTTIK